MIDLTLLTDILHHWDIVPARLRPDLRLCGSPERCAARLAVEDRTGTVLILEELAPHTIPTKRHIAERLQFLAGNGLRVVTPLTGTNGQVIQEVRSQFWQLTPYVESLPLDHETYWQDAWRGQALAQYLADMRQAATGMDLREPCFDLPGYVHRIMHDARQRHPQVLHALRNVWEILERRLPALHANLPVLFSHGDPHPENMLWEKTGIRTAIDWEFCGPGHCLYDPALLIGCVGSEGPDALDGPLVQTFLHTMRDLGQLDTEQEKALPVMILAQRTAWLAEWLRREDRDMMDFEVFYMQLLAGRCF